MGASAERGQTALMIYIEPTPYVLGLIERLARRRQAPVEALFIGADRSQPWNLTLRDIPASYLPAGVPAASAEISRRLAGGRYGLLHLAGWGHPTLLLSLLLGRLHGIAVFMESDTPLTHDLPLWKRAVKRILYPPLFRIPRKVLPAGTRQGEYFRHYGVEDGRIVKAQMTVDVAEIMRQSADLKTRQARQGLRREWGLAENQTVFIYVGRLEPCKGIQTLLAAFQGLARERPGAALLVVGDGSERPRVEAVARANNFVKYAGRLDQDAVIRAYHCADAAVLPSTREPWGLVVNEAMAAGLPVIVSDRAGCVEDLIRHGETGLVFPAGSAEKLQEAMRTILDDPRRRAELGEAGRRLISGWTLEEEARIILAAWDREESSYEMV